MTQGENCPDHRRRAGEAEAKDLLESLAEKAPAAPFIPPIASAPKNGLPINIFNLFVRRIK